MAPANVPCSKDLNQGAAYVFTFSFDGTPGSSATAVVADDKGSPFCSRNSTIGAGGTDFIQIQCPISAKAGGTP